MQSPPWLPSVVWTDYRVALLVTVICPLILLIWAFVQKAEVIQHLLVIYWRVASLLVITVYLFIGAQPVGFLSGWLSLVLIPISLWFWIDLNEEISEQPQTRLKLAFTSWRWSTTVYCILGALAEIPVLRCAFIQSQQMVEQSFCRIWLEPPWMFRELFHAGTKPGTLGLIGWIALVIYVLYLSYFVFIRLGKQGRSVTGQ
ncbi:MAG: DUF3177 family protein [Leptolyngbyaceae cyanobacterium RU_5_1]|nr:DUF3177 family protein [Leptolyngbyaceae cyanobacterium RU_5_1]